MSGDNTTLTQSCLVLVKRAIYCSDGNNLLIIFVLTIYFVRNLQCVANIDKNKNANFCQRFFFRFTLILCTINK